MAFTPNQITKDHILKAIEKIENEAIVLIPPTRWNVEINNKKYPPKEVMRYAHQQMNGQKVWEYGGGKETNKYLAKFDFPILDMAGNPLQELVNRYKKYIREKGLKEEIYKWKLLGQFQGRPNVDNENFLEEYSSIDFANLIYPVGKGAIKHLAEARTELYRDCFKALFDENVALIDRIKFFNEETLKIYRQIVPEERFSHHQDERTMSTFLTYHNPNLYTFYKDSFYQKLCSILAIKPKKKNEKYVHYMDLVNEFIDDYIKDDEELIDLVRSQIPSDDFQDTNFKILAQDILYQMLDKGIEEIDIENFSVYKISMGEFSIDETNELIKIKKVCVHRDTKSKGRSTESQGSIFENKMKIGDYFYLTHGNGADKIKLIGRISSPASLTEFNHYGEDGWLERSFELITNAKIKTKYIGLDKWWTPNNNSTFIQIKHNEIKDANKLIFEPYFRTKLISNTEIIEIEETNPLEEEKEMEIKPSLNQILFGPPGSGKTYSTINKALEIVGVEIIGKTRTEIKTLFDQKVQENRIVFTTFHQSMSYEDFIEGIKPLKPELEDDFVKYDVEDGIFKKVCDLAGSKVSVENFDKVYEMLLEKIENEKDEMLELKTVKQKSFWVGINSNGNLNLFTTENKNRQGVLTKEKIKAFANGVNLFVGWEGYALGIVNYMKSNLNLHIDINQKKNNNYVLIIDEINRGNVSAIFGELITLIEEDKRIGKPEALMVTLPYSKKPFGVPANLYIIGTMNTADRSVEALDTALRRRFSFEEMPPNYELPELSNELFGYPASKILKTINHRIEKLLDKDHAIGHSYFINKDNVSIVESFYKCIIPLLQEYFFGDFGKIGLVLGNGFVKQKEWDKTTDSFAEFDYDNSSDFEERNVFEIIDYRNKNQIYKIKEIEMTFGLSIKLLMKGTIE